MRVFVSYNSERKAGNLGRDGGQRKRSEKKGKKREKNRKREERKIAEKFLENFEPGLITQHSFSLIIGFKETSREKISFSGKTTSVEGNIFFRKHQEKTT